MNSPISVSTLNLQIKSLLEATFIQVYVEGEISNLTYHNSGHIYFSLKDESGTIYLGGIEGFVSFKPTTFTENKYLSPAVITDFSLFGKEVLAGEQNSPLTKNITFTDKIVLKHNQNSFSFRVAALSYQAMHKEDYLH